MGKVTDKIGQFMRGRYGTDQLNNAMLALALALVITGIFVKSGILNIFAWIILLLMIFRSFSRNGYKRRLENDRFMGVWTGIKAKLSLLIRRIREIRGYRFRRCRYCKAVLRLPRKAGRHTVQCPRCHNEFEVRVLF